MPERAKGWTIVMDRAFDKAFAQTWGGAPRTLAGECSWTGGEHGRTHRAVRFVVIHEADGSDTTWGVCEERYPRFLALAQDRAP